MAQPIASFATIAVFGGAILVGLNTPSAENKPVEKPKIVVENVEPIVEEKELQQSSVWVLADGSSENVCLIEKTRSISHATSILNVDPACHAVWFQTDEISVWQQDTSGNVILADTQGRAVASFEPSGDGALIPAPDTGIDLKLFPAS